MSFKFNATWRYSLILVAVIVAAEFLIMILFHSTSLGFELTKEAEAIADAILLIIISALPIYFWIIKPIIKATKRNQDKLLNLISALDGAAGAVLITDKDGIITYVNDVFTEVTGYTSEEVIGQNPRILQSGKQSHEFYQMMWRSIDRTDEWSGQLYNKRKDGHIYPELLHIKAIKDQHGNIKSYIGNITDITEQKRQEKLMLQAQKMETIGGLVGGVAHNFNNILAVITGNTYLARMNATDPKLDAFLQSINSAATGAEGMVKQLLSFTQENFHKKQEIKMLHILQDVMKVVQVGIAKDIQVTYHGSEEELVVYCDEIEIKQALINIFNNALDAIEGCQDKRVNVLLKLMSCDACPHAKSCSAYSSYVAQVIIEDSGCGIKEANLENIFDPFFTTKEVNKGTGLGLSMAKGTVESHGGCIHVSSTAGHGTKVEFCLPLTHAHISLKKPKTSPAKSKEHETILIIDDEPAVLNTLQQILLSLGYDVIAAESGEEGIKQFLEHSDTIALVISDVVMPEMDGPTTVAQIQKEKPKQPVMFITGYDNKQLASMDESIIVQKPFKIAELSQQIQNLLHPENRTS